MGLSKTQVEQLRDLGMSFHDIAQIAKVPTPVIAQIGLYGKTNDAVFDFDFQKVFEENGGKKAVEAKKEAKKSKEDSTKKEA